MNKRQCQAKRRDGVSLLEVLISIGVLAVGLLGVISLIPAAASLAETGARSDAMAIAGRRILREFKVRDFDHVSNLSANPPAGIAQVVNPGFTNPRRAFCFDPAGYALWTGNESDAEVYSFPSHSTINNNTTFLPRLKPPLTSLGSLAAFEEIFYFQDDLEFVLPQAANQDPQQVPLRYSGNGGVNLASKRYAKGDFSWFATLVPKVASSALGARNPSYELSIAVVRSRNTFQSNFVAVTNVQMFDGSGTITLDGTIDIKEGHWLMLMSGANGSVLPSPLTLNVPGQFEWFQVVSNNGNTLEVNGPNWLVTTPNTIAAVIPDVVAVYAKTITLRD